MGAIINPNTGRPVRDETGVDRRRHGGGAPRFMEGDQFRLKGIVLEVATIVEQGLILKPVGAVMSLKRFAEKELIPLRGLVFQVTYVSPPLEARQILKLKFRSFSKSYAKAMKKAAAAKGIR